MPIWGWKLIGMMAVVAAIASFGWRVSEWREAFKEMPAVRQALEEERKCGEESECGKRQKALATAQAAVTNTVVEKINAELTELRDRPIPTRVIRVCTAQGDVRDAAGATGAGQRPTPEGVVYGANEFDTRPLRELAQLADEVSTRCRGLLERDRALARAKVSE